MIELAAWVVFPLVTVAGCLGVGLLAERLAGVRLEPALLAPLGMSGALVLGGAVFSLGGGDALAAKAVGAAALVGFALALVSGSAAGRAGAGMARLRPGAGALAGVAAYALYMAPVALTGDATFLGYNLLNDTAIHLALVDYLGDHGAGLVQLPPSSYAAAITEYVGRDYPLGSHELLAVLRVATPHDAAELYQPFLATSVALAAAAVFALLRAAGYRAAAAAGAALVAAGGQLLYSFGLQGSIKELPLVAVLATAAALAPHAVRGERRAGAAALIGVCGAALYSIYGLYALAWLAPLALLLAVAARSARVALAGVVAFAVAAAPYFAPSIDYYGHHDVLEDAAELGPLAGALNPLQATGIWLGGDYRFEPETAAAATFVLALLALGGAVAGIVVAWRRRMWGPLAFVVPALVAYAAGAPRGSPYADAKLLAVLCAPLLLMALLGWGALPRARVRMAALAVLTGAVLVSDALAYRVALPAPMDRLGELEAVAERFEGRRGVMLNEFEEYAKHFGREAGMSNPYERWTAERGELREGVEPRAQRDYRLDELAPAFVQRQRVIVTRRSPAEDRPPVNFARVYRGRWYEAWERRGEAPAEHVPYGSRFSAAGLPHCGPLTRAAGPGDVVAAERPPAIVFDIARHTPLPPGWYRAAGDPSALETAKGGSVFASATTGEDRYAIWVRGRLARRSELLVDERRVGSAKAQERPWGWTRVGEVALDAGPHRLELRRPTRSLAPGDGARDVVGPVVAVSLAAPRLIRGPAREACGRPLDWVSRTGPSG